MLIVLQALPPDAIHRAQAASYELVFAIQGPFLVAILGAAYALRRPGMRAYAWVYGLLSVATLCSALSVLGLLNGSALWQRNVLLGCSMFALAASWRANRHALQALAGTTTASQPPLVPSLIAGTVATVLVFAVPLLPFTGAAAEFFASAPPRPIILVLMLLACYDSWRASRLSTASNVVALRLVALAFLALVVRQSYGIVSAVLAANGQPFDPNAITVLQTWTTVFNGVAILGALMIEERTAVADQAERLRVTEARLSRTQRLESLGQMAGGIAHDFANLLMVIDGGVSGARDTKNAEQASACLHDAADAVERASGLTRQLALFAAQRPAAVTTFSVAMRLQQLEPLLRRLVGRDITLDIHASPELNPVVAMDPSQFDQVLLNLVVNARDAMADGGSLGLTVSVGDADALPALTREQLSTNRVVSVRVADTGVGIPDAVLEQLFEPFYSTKGDRGTGLGLATVKSVVRTAHGAVTVDSLLGKGTTFAVHLPHAASSV